MQNIGYAKQQSIRGATNRNITMNKANSTTESIIEECTEADRTLKWTQYLIVVGFSPVTSPEETLTMLQEALDHIGNPEDGSTFTSGLKADRDYTLHMHMCRGWKVQRYTGTKNLQTGHIIKLTQRAIFGTFYAESSTVDKIYPAISRMRLPQGQRGLRALYFQCLPEPIHIERIHDPIKYPPPMRNQRHSHIQGQTRPYSSRNVYS